MHQRHVRMRFFNSGDSAAGIFRLAANGQILLVVDKISESLPDKRVVIDEKDAAFARSFSGCSCVHKARFNQSFNQSSSKILNLHVTTVPPVWLRATANFAPINPAPCFIRRSPSPGGSGSFCGKPTPSSAI